MPRPYSVCTLAFFALLAIGQAAGQALPTNSSLKGPYWVRYLGVNDGMGDAPTSFSGTFNFDGAGSFTVAGSGVIFTNSSAALKPAASGTYTVLSSGLVTLTNPFDSTNSCKITGGIGANGVVAATGVDSYCLDLFIAIPPSTNASAGTLSGSYFMGGMEFVGGNLASPRGVLSKITFDGKGGLSASNSGSSALNESTTTQNSGGATYTVAANGSGTFTLPPPPGVSAATQLFAGSKTVYVSPDGAFFVSGSPSGYDLQVGIQALPGGAIAGPANYGPFFTANLEYCDDNACPGGASAYSYGGAVTPLSSIGMLLEHQRVNGEGMVTSTSDIDYDATLTGAFSPNLNGALSGQGSGKIIGAGGNAGMIVGLNGDYSLTVWLKVPAYSGTGVFINPTGVVNASSSAPFTAQLAPGEIVSIYGSGLAPSTAAPSTLPFPVSFNGVQVTIGGIPAPVTVVSSGQINAIVPYSVVADSQGLVSVQVANGGAMSNIVKCRLGVTSPGISTIPDAGVPGSNSGGIGVAAVLHQDFTLVTTASPAKVGETVAVYLTGLGPVSPPVKEGASVPSSPLSKASNEVVVFLDDAYGNYQQATVVFAGLAPGLAAGANQINFTIPGGLTLNATGATLFTLEIDMLEFADADNYQALIPVAAH